MSIISRLFEDNKVELTDAIEPPDEDFWMIMSTRRRRWLVAYLVRAGDWVDVRDISDDMAEYENGPGYGSDERKACYSAIHQVHAPKLVEAGVINATERGTVYRANEVAERYFDAMMAATGEIL